MFDKFTNKPTSESKYDIVGKTDLDSTGGRSWSEYFSAEKLRAAWMPVRESPYLKYCKSTLVESVPLLQGKIQPRYSEGEWRSEAGVRNLIASGELDKSTAVILNSGGPHSVAMAVELMKIGYQPIIMFDTVSVHNGSNRAEQELATMLYFAKEVEQLKEQGAFRASSPPVFIMDCHRTDKPFTATDADNSYKYSNRDLPTAQELKGLGITKLVYLNEGDQVGKINASFQSTDRLQQDLKPIVAEWSAGGVAVKYTGVAPWKDDIQASSGLKACRLFDSLAFTSTDFESWLKKPS